MIEDPSAEYRQHLKDRQAHLPPESQLPLRPDDAPIPGPAGPTFYAEQLRRILAMLDALNGLEARDVMAVISPIAAANVLIPLFDTETVDEMEEGEDPVPIGWVTCEDEEAWVFVPAHTREQLTQLLHAHAMRQPVVISNS